MEIREERGRQREGHEGVERGEGKQGGAGVAGNDKDITVRRNLREEKGLFRALIGHTGLGNSWGGMYGIYTNSRGKVLSASTCLLAGEGRARNSLNF